jgi:hypothetical protein
MDEDQPFPRLIVPPPGVGVRRVSLGGGRWAPASFVFTFNDPARPYVATAEVVVAADGVPVVYWLTLTARLAPHVSYVDGNANLISRDVLDSRDWETITGDLRLPLTTVLNDALAEVSARGEDAPPGTSSRPGQQFKNVDDPFGSGQHVRPAAVPVAQSRRRRPRVLTPELLDEVARVVLAARAEGTSTRRAVAERFEIPMNTARNWIQAARAPGGPLHDAGGA